MGLRLRDFPSAHLTWRDLKVIVQQMPHTSALARARDPEGHLWAGLDVNLLAMIADLLVGANYQRGGGKGKQPTPIKRPGVGNDDNQQFGSDAMQIEDMTEWLGWAA